VSLRSHRTVGSNALFVVAYIVLALEGRGVVTQYWARMAAVFGERRLSSWNGK